MILINMGRATFRSVLVFQFEIASIDQMTPDRKLALFFVIRLSFLMFNSIQNFLVFATIVSIQKKHDH